MTSEVMDAMSSVTRLRAVTLAAATDGHTAGELLRHWRIRRRLSQLELSNRASVSTRHISFVENGRSVPTPAMVATLVDHLEVPLRVRNEVFLAAGYAPPYAERSLDHDELAPVLDGLRRLLDAHLPWPALLLDNHWNIVDSNAAVDALLDGCAAELLEPPVNAIRVTLDPRGLAPRIRNLAEWGGHLVRQLRHRADATHDPVLAALAEEASTLIGAGERGALGPVVTMEVDNGSDVMRLFSISARLETATDSTLEGFQLETFLPADTATMKLLQSARSHR